MSNVYIIIVCVSCGSVLVFIIVKNRMPQHLSLFKYFQPQPAMKCCIVDDDIDLLLREIVHSDVTICVNKMIKCVIVDKKSVKAVANTQENLNSEKKSK